MRPSLTLLLAISIVSATAVAGDAEKDTKTATVALMRQIMPPEAYDTMLDRCPQMSAGMKQAGGGTITPKQQKGMKAAVKEALPYEPVTWTGEIYAKHFTKKEIDDIAAFYATPTGKKVAKLLPALSGGRKKMGPLLMTRLPGRFEEARRRVARATRTTGPASGRCSPAAPVIWAGREGGGRR